MNKSFLYESLNQILPQKNELTVYNAWEVPAICCQGL